MKKCMHVVFGLCLLLTAGGALVYAEPTTNFWDDMESEVSDSPPVANIGTWSGGQVRDNFVDGIPDTPGGGLNALLISRTVAWPAIGTPTEQAVLTGTVHFEFDMYVANRGTNDAAIAADFFLLNQDYTGAGHPLNNAFPYTRVQRPDGVNAGVYEMAIGTNLAPVTIEEWHHYELDYTVGATNSLVFTLDAGTPVAVPEPFGFDGLTGDSIDEVIGLMFRPPGNPADSSEYYVDNVLLVIDNPPLKEEPAIAMDIANTRAFAFESLVGIRYGLESTADLVGGLGEPKAARLLPGSGTAFATERNRML